MKVVRLDYYEARKLQRENPEAYSDYRASIELLQGQFNARFGMIEPYIDTVRNKEDFAGSIWGFDNLKLAKDLTQEANRKYDFIIERTNYIVGEITDAAALQVGAKGDLNGFIDGTRGRAKVQTIGAGGYNIQCFHFRTLIHKA